MANHAVIGLNQLSREFKNLAGKEIKAAAKSMTFGGAALVKKEAKANVKRMGLVQTGALHRNIIVKRDKYPIGNSTGHIVKVRHGKQVDKLKRTNKTVVARKGGGVKIKRDNDPFYWRWQEFGWRTKSGKYIQGRRPIGRAYQSKESQIPDAMIEAYEKRMKRKRSAHGRNMIKWGYR